MFTNSLPEFLFVSDSFIYSRMSYLSIVYRAPSIVPMLRNCAEINYVVVIGETKLLKAFWCTVYLSSLWYQFLICILSYIAYFIFTHTQKQSVNNYFIDLKAVTTKEEEQKCSTWKDPACCCYIDRSLHDHNLSIDRKSRRWDITAA